MDALFSAYPLGSLRFFRKVLWFGFVTGVCVQLPMLLLLAESWTERRFCARVLRGYHLARFALFLAQLPLRASVLRSLARIRRMHSRVLVVQALEEMCKGWAWRCNSVTAVGAYALFAFAAVFAVVGKHCGQPDPYLPQTLLGSAAAPSESLVPMLYTGLLCNVALFVLHMLVSLLWLRQLLSEDAFDASAWGAGVGESQLEQWSRVITFPRQVQVQEAAAASAGDAQPSSSPSPSADPSPSPSPDASSSPPLGSPLVIDGYRLTDPTCSICFGDYAPGHRLRLLRCAHAGHQSCFDAWLSRKGTCPICARAVDAPAQRNNFTQGVLGGSEGGEEGKEKQEGVRQRLQAPLGGSNSSSGSSGGSPWAAWPHDPASQLPRPGDGSGDRIVGVVLTPPPPPSAQQGCSSEGGLEGAPAGAAAAAAGLDERAPASSLPGGLSQSEMDALAALEGESAAPVRLSAPASSSSASSAPSSAAASEELAPPSVRTVVPSLEPAAQQAASASEGASAPARSARPVQQRSANPFLPPAAAAAPAATLLSASRFSSAAALPPPPAAAAAAAPSLSAFPSLLSPSWREELDAWGEEREELEEAAAAEAGEESRDSAEEECKAVMPPEGRAEAQERPSIPPMDRTSFAATPAVRPPAASAAADAAVERLFRQWQMEEASQQTQQPPRPPQDRASSGLSAAEAQRRAEEVAGGREELKANKGP